jgi:hypothetical protein
MSEDLVPYDARTQVERAMPAKDMLRHASQIAEVLAPVIEKRHLYAQIGDKRHVLFEGWTTLGALCGPLLGETVSAVVAWTRPIDGGFEARVEAITYSGRVVGAAEAQCTREEKRWADAEDYAIRSMAQTRAGSKAMRMPLGWIMQLSGFEATPAEEMDGVAPRPQQQRRREAAQPRQASVPESVKAQRRFWAQAKDAGFETAGDVHAALGLRKEKGALAEYIANRLLESGEDEADVWNDLLAKLMNGGKIGSAVVEVEEPIE